MLFVDGENLLARGTSVLKADSVIPSKNDYHDPDAYLWWHKVHVRGLARHALSLWETIEEIPVRAFLYASSPGDNVRLTEQREKLHALGFHPEVFHKPKRGRAKRVDITLARDMLAHAFRDNYDVAVLMAGDGDYVPLVEEVKRIGKVVWVCWFEHPDGGLNKQLRLASDLFMGIDRSFKQMWEKS